MMLGPSSPPLTTLATVSKRSLPLGLAFLGPWQGKQLFSKMGWISVSNDMFSLVEGGGSLLGSMSFGPALAPTAIRRQPVNKSLRGNCALMGCIYPTNWRAVKKPHSEGINK